MPPPANPGAAILRISPKPPRTYRTGIAFIVFFAGERAVVIARASLARTPLQPLFSSDLTHVEHRRAGRGTRCDVNASLSREIRDRRGASVAGLSPRGADAAGIQQGESNPEPFGPASDDLSGRSKGGSRTLDTANHVRLLYPLSYIALDHRACSRGTRSSMAATRRCGSEPQPLTRTAPSGPR